MYDIKSIETGQRTINSTQNFLINYFQQNPQTNKINQNQNNKNICKSISSMITESTTSSNINNMSLRRRRIFQRQTCLISIMIAFAFGLILGIFVPIIGLSTVFTTSVDQLLNNSSHNKSDLVLQLNNIGDYDTIPKHPLSDFPTIYELRQQQQQQNQHNQILSPNTKNTIVDQYSVSFVHDDIINNKKLPVEEVFRNAFHLEQDKLSDDTMIVKKLDANDGSIKEYRVQRTSDGMFRKGPEHRISKPSVIEQVLSINHQDNINNNNNHNNDHQNDNIDQEKLKISGSSVQFVPIKLKNSIENQLQQHHQQQQQKSNDYIKDDIYWGDLIEKSIPTGFNDFDTDNWNNYIKSSTVVRLENGCGRMQNRLVIFSDGKRACARYRQNTDQIQGELFSFYLGRLLNLTNLAPSTASVINLETQLWSQAINDIQIAQWKSTRPVVLTKWLPDLEPAGIPIAFQPLERHLNKYDVWNITLSMTGSMVKENQQQQQQQQQQLKEDEKDENILKNNNKNINNNNNHYRLQKDQIENKKGLLKRLGANTNNIINNQSFNQSADSIIDSLNRSSTNNNNNNNQSQQKNHTNDQQHNNNDTKILNRLIELAQWSDLIIFDYLIANLDRVVNNLYNYQWNSDIMAAPAHNLAKQVNTQLLIFLDNESGLLHGYRLLKKYEAYHGLLLDNLCVFRKPTIILLKSLRDYGVGHQLQDIFERSTSHQLRDVLPSLPDKSIKILNDRIDRVLGQVQKCRDLFSDR